MYWTKLLGLLGVAFLAVFVFGALALLVTTLLADVAAIATIALVIAFVGGLSILGSKSKQWRQNTYW